MMAPLAKPQILRKDIRIESVGLQNESAFSNESSIFSHEKSAWPADSHIAVSSYANSMLDSGNKNVSLNSNNDNC